MAELRRADPRRAAHARLGALAEIYGDCPDCAYGQQEDESGMLYVCPTCRGTGYPASPRTDRTEEES